LEQQRMRALVEDALRQVRPQVGVLLVGLHAVCGHHGVAQRGLHAAHVHGVVDDRVGREQLRAALPDRAPAEIRVLARGRGVALVEAAKTLEQRAWIGDVARLEVRGRLRDPDRLGVRVEPVQLIRPGERGALDDRVRSTRARCEQRIEPARRRHAVVVGERHDRRAGAPPAGVARPCRPSRHRLAKYLQAERSALELVLQQRRRSVARRVVDDDHLEAARLQRLGAQATEEVRQPPLAVVGRQDDRDVGCRAHGVQRTSPPPAPLSRR
jgi:hypothetical protein